MPNKGLVILGDLGGTRLRLAVQGTDGPENIRTCLTHDFATLADALDNYMPDLKDASLFLSFAKKVNADGIYHLDQAHKKGAWSFTIDNLKQETGLAQVHILHDMQAMGRALFHADRHVFEPIIRSVPQDGWRVIINVGTGLGHAFANPQDHSVHDTFGGHFPPVAITDEQKSVVNDWQEKFGTERTFIAEEILSGRGYHALEQYDPKNFNRLFCEFLGLYANTLSVAMHAFGGVYLCGGVVEKLLADNRFDRHAFEKFYVLKNVPIVHDQLSACPVFRVGKPHTALYGLDVYAQGISDH